MKCMKIFNIFFFAGIMQTKTIILHSEKKYEH